MKKGERKVRDRTIAAVNICVGLEGHYWAGKIEYEQLVKIFPSMLHLLKSITVL